MICGEIVMCGEIVICGGTPISSDIPKLYFEMLVVCFLCKSIIPTHENVTAVRKVTKMTIFLPECSWVG